jgi:AraC-like DNA-binding protein
MNYQVFKPSESLSKFVRFFWVLENDDNSTPFIHRSIADGSAELIFHYKGAFEELKDNVKVKQAFSMVHAQSQKSRRFETKEKFGIFGAYLYPFALPLLFKMPSFELSNQMPDISDLLGNEGQILEEKMMLAKDNCSRVDILSNYLECKLMKNDFLHPVTKAIYHIIHSRDLVSVPSLADKFCLSERQFERKFKELAGFSPKLYSRIIRFGKTVSYYGNTSKSLTEIAFDCGYYDQSHFIHEFKEFSGYHPKEYFFGKPEGADYRLT